MNQSRPKTIQIFLPDGNARSIRIAEITSRTVQAVQIPRSKLEVVGVRKEVKQPGIYFLFGKSEDLAKDRVYIGEAENCLDRLNTHNRNKDFWNTAVAITSKTERFTKGHIKYLEWHSHQKAEQASRYKVGNSNNPSEPYLPEPDQADLLDNFETIKVLLSTLGFPIFDEVRKTGISRAGDFSFDESQSGQEDNIYILDRHHIKAKGQYTEDGFLVFEGSEAMKDFKKSAPDYVKRIREQLINDEIIKLIQEENKFVFREDYIFNSPSGASSLVTGVSSSGWRAWKEEETGKSLGEIVRKD